MSGLRASPKAVILVGGPGTRLQPLTYHIPKPMVPILNRPFMEHTIAYLKHCGIENIILTLSYLPEVIQDHFGDGSELGAQLIYCLENSPLGTAGAVKNAEQHLSSTFVVLNGDVFTDLDIADMLAFHQHKRAKATIALRWVDDISGFGVVETERDNRVRRFIEKPAPDEATTNWINAGIYILEPEALEHVPANTHYMFERGLFPLLLELGEPVYGYQFSGYWLDMGTPGKYLSLNCDLLLSKTSSPLIHGFHKDKIYYGQDVIIHPQARIVEPVVIGNKCKVSQGAYIRGPVVIGPDCHVEESASIESAILWSNVRVGAGAKVKQCIIASNTSIGRNRQITNSVVTASQTAPLSP